MSFHRLFKRDLTDFSKIEGAPAWADEVQRFLVRKHNTYFDFDYDSWQPKSIIAITSFHGDVGAEEFSEIDFKAACEMEKSVLEQYGERFCTRVDTVDEHVYLVITEK